MAEKIITLGRRGDLHARRQAMKFVFDGRVVKKVFDEIGPRMASRPGGYLRITGIEPRKGDGARMATIELVDLVDAPATPRPQRVTAAPTAAPRATAPAVAPAEPETPAEEEVEAAEEAVLQDEAVAEAETTEEPTAEAGRATEAEAEAEASAEADEGEAEA